jgi:5-methylcytosine-specific restriction endonuclease McrA
MPIDKNRYPPDWEARAERIKERDQYTCQHCQATAEADGVVLTVAHLDHDETNWEVEDDRLLTLCASCHLRYDAPDNAMRRRYGKQYRDNQYSLFNL